MDRTQEMALKATIAREYGVEMDHCRTLWKGSQRRVVMSLRAT